MNNKIKKTLITLLSTLGAILIVTTATYALGTLTPSGTAGDDTHYSLNDIYEKISDYSYTPTATSSPFDVSGTVEEEFYSLTEIWNVLSNQPDLVADNIMEGSTILGVDGTATTSLIWSTEQNGLSWNNAVIACAGTIDGSTGWRLPTIDELSQGILYDYVTENNGGDRFSEFYGYWSDTPFTVEYAYTASWNSMAGFSYTYEDIDTVVAFYCVK